MTALPIEDRVEIQDLVARYTFHTDVKDYAAVPPLFAEDGVWDESVLGAPAAEGRAAIEQTFAGFETAGIDSIIHINGCHLISAYDGDSASGSSHLHAEIRALGRTVRILGYYADDYVKVDGTWLFQRRELVELAPTEGLPTAEELEALAGGAA
jgi:ketosteroid isomerase-like protein